MMTTSTDVRQFLRGLPVLAGELPVFDPDQAPDRPDRLFLDWLGAAVGAGVREPHAMTLSTIGADGVPNARVLILKGVDDQGWEFAGQATSPKGAELSRHPGAALTFHWPEQARQIRVRGPVSPAAPERSAADFAARSAPARAEARLGRQSRPVTGVVTAPAGAGWTLYVLAATEVEFWQGDRERRHTRLRYARSAGGWTREMLWP